MTVSALEAPLKANVLDTALEAWTFEEGQILGDLAFLPEGLRSVWHVHEPVRKAFHPHSAKALEL